MTTQVTATRLSATGYVVQQPIRLRALHFASAAAAGTLTVRDGGASGTTRLVIDTPASVTFGEYMKLPGLGIKFNTDMHATMANITGVTFFWG